MVTAAQRSRADPRSKEQILAAARTALGDDHRSPTMARLADAAGVSLRQLYRLFGCRQTLLHELHREPPPGARERVLESALELLGQSTLADLSMDQLAALSGVSRATLYRIFPGKPALFRELIATYSPWEAVARVLESSAALANATPDQIMRRVAHAVSQAMSGRSGVLLRMVLEMSRGNPDTVEGVQRSMAHGLPDLVRYLNQQMAAGRLRKSEPLLALQMLAGPIVVHELTRPFAGLVGVSATREQVVDQIVDLWLRAMAPDRRREMEY